MYPNSPGSRFDHDDYRDKHLPLIKRRMGAACVEERALAGGAVCFLRKPFEGGYSYRLHRRDAGAANTKV